jgi:hypothetical protein
MFVVAYRVCRMNQSTNTSTSFVSGIRAAVGVVADVQTYKNLVYLFLAFPLGMIYYVVLVVGFTLGLGLSVVVVGLGILLGTAIGLRLIADFERRLANALLGTEIRQPDDVENEGGIVGTARAYLQASSTWRGLGFVVLKFLLGIVSFVLLLTFVGAAAELLLLPLFPGGVFNVTVNGWEIARGFETTTQRAAAVPAGAVLGLVGLHVLNAFAGANASIAASLLGANGSGDAEQSA